MSKPEVDTVARATIKEFATAIRKAGISPSMREIEIDLAVERLREEHGIVVDQKRFASLVAR